MTTITNRFAALSVDDEHDTRSATYRTAPHVSGSPQQRQQQHQHQAPKRGYVPPNLRRNQQSSVPVTQSRLVPNVTSVSDFPTLGNSHTPVVTNKTSQQETRVGWASKARSWAEHEAAGHEHERYRKQEEQEHMITLSRSTFRSKSVPMFSPGTEEYSTYSRKYTPSYTNNEDEVNDVIDPVEAYVGGYDHARYTAYDYQEDAEEQEYPPENDGRYTPPYPPNPY